MPRGYSIKNNFNIKANISYVTFRDKLRLSLIQFHDLDTILRAQDTVYENKVILLFLVYFGSFI